MKFPNNLVTNFENGLYFVPLGGASEIGMNLNLYASDDQWILVDCGVTFKNEFGIQKVMADPNFIEDRQNKLLGIVITHGHEDHIGAIANIWPLLRCPVYATPFTMTLIKGKLMEAGLLDKVELIEIQLEESMEIGPFDIRYVGLTHSIPESNGLMIKTPYGNIFHTGDWKIDSAPVVGPSFDEKKFKKLGKEGVLAMICDSTNVFEEGNAGSEEDVRKNLIKLVKKQKNRVVITCFASNLARVETCLAAAKESGRSVVLMGRSMETMVAAGTLNHYFSTVARLSPHEAKELPRNKVLYICSGSQGEPNAALKRIASGSHQHVKLEEDDVVIFSSRKIPGNEIRISSLKNDLVRLGVTLIGTKKDGLLHVSGHPCREDLRKMYNWIRPKIAIPVHGELQHLAEHAKFITEECDIESVLIPENGSVISLSQGRLEGRVATGYLGEDGSYLVDLYGPVVKDRVKLSQAGIIFVSLLWQGEDSLSDVRITTRGIMEDAAKDFEKKLMDKVKELFPINTLVSREQLEEDIRILVRRYVLQKRGLKTIVQVHSLDS